MIKRQVAEFYEVTERTIDNLIEKYNSDLTKNGYDIIRGKRLTDFKLVFAECFDGEMDFIVKINTSLSCDSVNLGYLESTLELMQDNLKESPDFLKTTLTDVKRASSMLCTCIDNIQERLDQGLEYTPP